MSATTISPDTVHAHRQTEYRFCGEPKFTLRIDQPSPELLELQQAHRVEGSAFVTAFNPYSQPTDLGVNEQRQLALVRQLRAAGYTVFPGIGQHPSNDWPGEHSCLVLGLDRDAAKGLGAELEQNAIVWSGPDGIPELVLLR